MELAKEEIKEYVNTKKVKKKKKSEGRTGVIATNQISI